MLTEPSKLRRHLALIGKLLAEERDSVGSELATWHDHDWQDFAAFLNEHRIRPVFAHALSRWPDCSSAVPGWLQHDLETYSVTLAESESRFADLRERVAAVFDRQRLDYLVLKGDTIAKRFYPADHRRHQFDLDLLVHPTDVERTIASLAGLGFRLAEGQLAKQQPNSNGASRRLEQLRRPGRLADDHAVGLSDGTLSIDLHWTLRQGPDYRLSLADLWDTATRVTVGSGTTPTLSDEYLLVMMCLSLAQDLGRGAARGKHFVDFHYVLKQIGDLAGSDGFWQRRRRERIDVVCREAFGLCETVFPGTLPASTVSVLNTASGDWGVTPAETVWRLLGNPRQAKENALWLLDVHQYWQPRRLLALVRQDLTHPGRIPLATFRLARYASRIAARSLRVVSRRQTPAIAGR